MQFEKHVRVRQEKFGAVVFETLSEKLFVTNETGARILRLLEERKSVDAVAADLSRVYRKEPVGIREEVQEFVQKLQTNGIMMKEPQE
ncbi:MAG: PqqD family protein [Acidobacteriota bacterium]